MRILLVSHRYPPHGLGGVEIWTRTLAHALAAEGHVVAVAARDDREQSPFPPFTLVEEVDGPVRVHWLRHRHDFARRYRDSWDDRRVLRACSALLDAFRPDLLHLAHPDGWGVQPARAARLRGVPVAVTLHDYKWICARGQMIRPPGRSCERADEERCVRCVGDQLERGPLRGLLARHAPETLRQRALLRSGAVPVEERPDPGERARLRWHRRQRALLSVLREADLVSAPSRFIADRFAAHGLRRPVIVIRHGLDDGGPQPDPRRPMSHGPLRLGYFGTAVASKGIGLLLDAVAALPKGSVRLELHGPPVDQLPPLPAAAHAFGPYEAGTATGRMRGLDLVALPSTWDENAPLVAVEARRAGLPLLVSDRGGLPEMVRHGEDGWVLPAGDTEAWAEEIMLLAADRSRLRGARAAVLGPPSAGAMARAYLARYRELLAPSV